MPCQPDIMALLKKAGINSGGRENSKNDGVSSDFSWRNPGIFLYCFVTLRESNLFSVDPHYYTARKKRHAKKWCDRLFFRVIQNPIGWDRVFGARDEHCGGVTTFVGGARRRPGPTRPAGPRRPERCLPAVSLSQAKRPFSSTAPRSGRCRWSWGRRYHRGK